MLKAKKRRRDIARNKVININMLKKLVRKREDGRMRMKCIILIHTNIIHREEKKIMEESTKIEEEEEEADNTVVKEEVEDSMVDKQEVVGMVEEVEEDRENMMKR